MLAQPVKPTILPEKTLPAPIDGAAECDRKLCR